MRTLLLTFGIFLLSISNSFSGVGKSYDQCVNLYGDPAGGKDNSYVFYAGALIYVCDFDHKKICKGMSAMTESKLPLTKAEITLVLDTNPFGGTWTLQNGSDSRWTHSSGEWTAALIRGNLTIQKP